MVKKWNTKWRRYWQLHLHVAFWYFVIISCFPGDVVGSVVQVLYMSYVQKSHWNIGNAFLVLRLSSTMLMLMYEKKMTQVKSLMWKGSHTYSASTLRTSLVYLCHWVCLLALPWNHSSNDHVFPVWFRVSSSGWPQHQSFIFKARIKGHQLYWKVSVSFSHRSSQRGIRYLSEAEPDNVFPPAPSPLPCMTPPGRGFNPPTHFPPPPPRTHDLMSPFDHSLQINSTCSRWFSLTSRIRSSSTSCYDQVPTSARNASDQRL